MADLMSAGPNGPCPYPGELSVTIEAHECMNMAKLELCECMHQETLEAST